MFSIVSTKDGSQTVFSEKFGTTFHSIHGAVQESLHVFINNGLNYISHRQKNISVLEIGFGTGLNALLTLMESEKQNINVKYSTIEKFPLPADMFEFLNYQDLFSGWKEIFLSLHSSDWEHEHQLSEHFLFKKYEEDFENFIPDKKYDLIYFDAFAPSCQPELWSHDMMKKLYDALHPEGILVTYCAKGAFKRTLKSVGFKAESLPGAPGKREMTRAIK